MLELWRPPRGAGEPIGCVATTYTFMPGLFDEQCLARFLEIESEPDREDLAFLLERETRLGSVYAGILVDHTQAGVEHSLRWDVLPVRIPRGKQHAKLTLLAWSRYVRIVVASANLTKPGYRSNFEVAGAVELTPESTDPVRLADALGFLRDLLRFVPGGAAKLPTIERAAAFLRQVERLTVDWKRPRGSSALHQRLVFNLPAPERGGAGRQALRGAIDECRRRGGSPSGARVVSPFFDPDVESSRAVAELCQSLLRGAERWLEIFVPSAGEVAGARPARLAAPRSLWTTPESRRTAIEIGVLPREDGEGNLRSWHAKLYGFEAEGYAALMIGSSNFTCAGLGIGGGGNAEANLLTLVERERYGREIGELEAVWPDAELLEDPEAAEWLGALPENDEESQPERPPLPAGFLAASYRAGGARALILHLDPDSLPGQWQVHAVGRDRGLVLSSGGWQAEGRPRELRIPWAPIQPPEKLRVEWDESEAFWPLNVVDGRELPPPPRLAEMTADDMLGILAAADPSGAFRAWAKGQSISGEFDDDLDSAAPVELDPLRAHSLDATFLHRIRRRARALARLRANLERPLWGRQALEWRLRGLIGVEALASRLVREFEKQPAKRDEALLVLADFLIVLREVDYQPRDGSLGRREFEAVYRPFLAELTSQLDSAVDALDSARESVSGAVRDFWSRVGAMCRE